jgi:hypothetical protein
VSPSADGLIHHPLCTRPSVHRSSPLQRLHSQQPPQCKHLRRRAYREGCTQCGGWGSPTKRMVSEDARAHTQITHTASKRAAHLYGRISINRIIYITKSRYFIYELFPILFYWSCLPTSNLFQFVCWIIVHKILLFKCSIGLYLYNKLIEHQPIIPWIGWTCNVINQ